MTQHIRTLAQTNPAVGGEPDNRSVEERLASGFILIDKPAGPTSHQLASRARDPFGQLTRSWRHFRPICHRSATFDVWKGHEDHEEDSEP